MEQEYKLPLSTAILINLNIMLGAGIFINTVTLAKIAGGLSPLSYITVGILMLPIIMSMAKLVELFPCGSFYIYGKEIKPIIGFLSGWGYFTGKLASSAITIHFSSLLITSTIPILFSLKPIYLDAAIITTFAILNTLKMKASSKIQMCFIALKSIPIIFIILIGLLYFSGENFASNNLIWKGLPLSLPFVVYAFTGFEASCSLSKHIENSEVNGPKAILYSFALAVSIAALYQFNFFAAVGSQLIKAGSYVEAFPIFLSNIFNFSSSISSKIQALPQLAIAASALGGAYGVFFSNHWNLYELANHKFTFFASYLTKFNKHKIPFLCVITEAIITFSYICLFSGSNIVLQQIGAFGCLLTYSFSVLALFKITRSPISILGLLSSMSLITFSLISFSKNALNGIIVFSFIILAGLIMFKIRQNKLK